MLIGHVLSQVTFKDSKGQVLILKVMVGKDEALLLMLFQVRAPLGCACGSFPYLFLAAVVSRGWFEEFFFLCLSLLSLQEVSESNL